MSSSKTAEEVEELTDPGVSDEEATDHGNPSDFMNDSEPDFIPPSDIMKIMMRSGTGKSSLGIDPKRPMVLEVNQIWDNLLLDTKHFTKDGPAITVGSSVGWRWDFLGIDMGWVKPPLHLLLRYTPPVWSDIRNDWRNDFYLPDTALSSGLEHPLFVWKDDSYEAMVPTHWDGFADVGERRLSLDELVAEGLAAKKGDLYEIPMNDGTKLMLESQGIVFFSHMVKPGKRIISRVGDDLDYPFLAIAGLLCFMGMLFGILMWRMPEPPQSDVAEIPDRLVELMVEKPEEEVKKKKVATNPDAGEGAKAKKEEGKTGKKDAKMQKARGNKVKMDQQKIDRQIAENAGVLGALADAGAMDGIFGSSSLSSDITGGIGGLVGAKGTQIGSGGLGSRGGGLGGGGTAEGLGGYGTKGSGSGSSGYGRGGGNFGKKSSGAIGKPGGDPIILGALDRSLIDEVIKRHMNQIRYCYQRELTKNPNLGGKVVIKFTIAKDGSVASAKKKTSTMGNAAVESCIANRFMRMKFPTPKGGGIVIVSYPFMFAPG